MISTAQLDAIAARAARLEQELQDGAASGARYAELRRAHAALQPALAAIAQWRRLVREEDEARAMQASEDADLRALADEELQRLAPLRAESEAALRRALIVRDAADDANVIVELRAGTGGSEAALFAGDLLAMYQRYAGVRGWEVELLSQTQGEHGGVKEAVLAVRGRAVFAELKYERGVHRVQRVPVTESSGRIHTSAATVAVLPEPRATQLQIHDKDLRIDVFRASGPGGQSVNTTDSAVRVTHVPSGIVVSQQDEKSQHKNKARALQILRARLYAQERESAAAERAAARRAQVGSGDRSERIRTYNFPQTRVTDHRIGLTLHKLPEVLAGQALREIITALQKDAETRALSEEPSAE